MALASAAFAVQQARVRGASIAGALVTLAAAWLSVHLAPWPLPPAHSSAAGRGVLLAQCLLGPGIVLLALIIRLGNHRFSSAHDIQAAASATQDSAVARQLQAQITNTVEQLLVTTVSYANFTCAAPAHWLQLLPTASALFVLGRLAFCLGYERGAGGRAPGFALTSLPSLLVLALAVWCVAVGPAAI